MELFFSKGISSGETVLDKDESNHCIRVLRHRSGDTINVIDGLGTLYECRISDDDPKSVSFTILEKKEGFGSHPYRLHLAVAPPKNMERFEWFAEKATEIGVDEISPIFGDCSERKVFKGERVERLVISAAKQSYKALFPVLNPACGVMDFITACKERSGLKLICHCGQDEVNGVERGPVTEYLDKYGADDVTVMIGPEGDFSRREVEYALKCGWKSTSLGESRLRIESAALTAAVAVYLKNIR